MQLAKAMDAGHIAGVCSGKNEAIVSILAFISDPSIILYCVEAHPISSKETGQGEWSNRGGGLHQGGCC